MTACSISGEGSDVEFTVTQAKRRLRLRWVNTLTVAYIIWNDLTPDERHEFVRGANLMTWIFP